MSRTTTPDAPTFTDYKEMLLQSGLLKRQDVMKVVAQLEADGVNTLGDCRPLAKQLMKAGLITEWQNYHLLQGRAKGFFMGHYKLLTHRATGGMSTVFLAEHLVLHRKVALKVLSPSYANDKVLLKRFYIEMRALASLDHPNIVRVFDCGVGQGKFHYVVLEWVEGDDLQKTIENVGPLPYEKAADYIRQAAVALAVVHDQGMVHRDIKPANLLLNTQGVVKLLDMGLVRMLRQEDRNMTLVHHEAVLGTVDYLAPEQALDSHNVDPRADVYGLGCTLYYLLTGRPPFGKGTFAEVLVRHQSHQPPSILETRPDAPRQLVDLCMEMMTKDPKHRTQSCSAVAERLADWLADCQSATLDSSAGFFDKSQLGDPANGPDPMLTEVRIDPEINPLAHAMLAESRRASGFSFGRLWRVVPATVDVLRWMARR